TQGVRTGCEEVYAVIVPNLDAFGPDEKNNTQKIREQISSEVARLSENLAEYKRIMAFEVRLDELPKTATRKIRRKEIAEAVNR
ncbi:MAG: hypothetical protein KKF80_05800, partial [Candidatus Omnitrophica bacterium]|nr:hypothetical protein [Candidatus Omnitrophota bacterium]